MNTSPLEGSYFQLKNQDIHGVTNAKHRPEERQRDSNKKEMEIQKEKRNASYFIKIENVRFM